MEEKQSFVVTGFLCLITSIIVGYLIVEEPRIISPFSRAVHNIIKGNTIWGLSQMLGVMLSKILY